LMLRLEPEPTYEELPAARRRDGRLVQQRDGRSVPVQRANVHVRNSGAHATRASPGSEAEILECRARL
jgi:hypothetical protein